MRVGQVGQGTLTVVNMEEAMCAASYNALLHADLDLAGRTHRDLMTAQQALDIAVADRVLCSVLRPRFMTEERSSELARISQILAGVLERAGRVLLSSERLLDLIGASEQEREIWAIDPGYAGMALTSRLDSFMVGTRPQFIEYNAESPAAIGFCDILSHIFRRLPSMQEWEQARSMRGFGMRRHLLDTLLWAYRERGGEGTPSVAITDWKQVITRRDFELCADYFRTNGVPAVIADPRELEYRGGKLWAGERHITLVYRRVLLHELLDKADEAAGLLQAYRDGAICMVNSPRSKLLHKKALFALLTDGRLDLPLTEEERDVVETCIPWTRLMKPGRTTYRGREIDLERFVVDSQERLVLKPADDYGGKGVILGWETSPDAWARAIETSQERLHVVQERVPMPQGRFPVWDGNGLAIETLLVDTDPMLFRGVMGGILTRMSSSTLLNVSAGTGSSAPTFVVPEQGE